MAESGIDVAIRELEREQKRIREAILMLKRIRPGGSNPSPRGRRRLSPEASRKISVAAKKRWAARRAAPARSQK